MIYLSYSCYVLFRHRKIVSFLVFLTGYFILYTYSALWEIFVLRRSRFVSIGGVLHSTVSGNQSGDDAIHYNVESKKRTHDEGYVGLLTIYTCQRYVPWYPYSSFNSIHYTI